MKKKFIAENKELDNVIDFIHNELEKDVDMKTITKIDLVIEEIFVNIAIINLDFNFLKKFIF